MNVGVDMSGRTVQRERRRLFLGGPSDPGYRMVFARARPMRAVPPLVAP